MKRFLFTGIGGTVCIALCTFFCYSLSDSSEKNIIQNLRNGMTSQEVFEIIGDNYNYSYEGYPLANGVSKTVYNYNIDNIELFGTDIKSCMFVEIAEDDKLVNYGYHIGTYSDENNKDIYPYTQSELISEYDNIYNKLSEWYGEGEEYIDDEYSNILKGYEWHTEYGDIWFIVGTDLWGSPGQNEIVLSCSDMKNE